MGGHATGRATFDKGIVVETVNGRIYLYLDQKIYEALLSQLVPGGEALRLLDALKYVGIDPNSIQRINVYANVRLDMDVGVDLPRLRLHPQEFQIKVGPKIAFEPDLKIARLSVYAGGYLGGNFDLDPFALKKITAEMYIGYKVSTWFLPVHSWEGVWFNYEYHLSAARGIDLASALAFDNGWVLLPVKRTDASTTMDRNYLTDGPERFVLGGRGASPSADDSSKASAIRADMTTLEAFRAVGRMADQPVAKNGNVEKQDEPVHAAGDPTPQSGQADLTLVENVFPGADPALAGKGQELMLLYVGDNGGANPLQATDIRWTRFDGTNWSAPATIHTNTQAEFSPQVAYDGNGDAIAVWERVTDLNFNTPDLAAMAAQMEVVWAKWNHASGQWSTPVPLTSNGYLDHAPLLCGPMADGSVLAVWTANTANLLMGTNGAGSQVLWAQWNPASQGWSSPKTLLADLPYRLSQSLSGVSNLAVYAWTRDLDGDQNTVADQQVFFAEWSSSGWGAPVAMTSGAEGNRNARVAVSTRAVGSSAEGFESGDFSAQSWTFTGNAPWTVQSGTVRSGSYAAASGTITHNQTSGMALSLDCQAGEVSFAYSISSEGGFDFLRFYIDGVQQGSWSGTVGWTTVSYPVTAGPHTFEWRYTKDGSVSSGSDKAWVDDIVLPASPGQQFYVVWQQGDDLVLSADKGASSSLVRAGSQTAGFADYAMTIGPAGNLALLWQDMAETGSDAHYRMLDPASGTWSQDALMFQDSPLERSFAPVWDDVGNLTVAYNKVEIIYTNKTVELEGGGTVTITNVPQPGRVDLCVTKRALVKDLALTPGEFTASADNYLPGAAVTLSATLRNLGDLAVSNAVVAFYQGNPTTGGVLITNITIAGWLDGAATNTVSALWVVPEPATNHVLYAVADPAGVVAEFDEANNQLSLSLGGTDLAVSLVSHSAETNGAVRVIAQVQNLGAPSAPNSVLAIRRAGQTNAPLTTVAVPLLEPGRLAQVALDLPPGTQPEGEAVYRLFADETKVVADVDTSNNTTAFAVNLWVDSDGDGLPDSFENQYSFLDPNDPNDALLDYDEDGVSNLAEYRAGTSPDDPLSYLRLTAITVGGSEGVEIAWGSSLNKLYTVQRSAALEAGFTNLVEHIQSTPPENVYRDISATNAAAFFYRILVE